MESINVYLFRLIIMWGNGNCLGKKFRICNPSVNRG